MDRPALTMMLAAVAMTGSPAVADTVAGHLGGVGGGDAGDFWVSDNSLPQYMADQFHLDAATSMTGVRWWGTATDGTSTGGLSAFILTIFEVDAGLPGAAVHSESISPGVLTASADAAPDQFGGWRYEASLSGWGLGAGDYFISISGEASTIGGAKWIWQGLLDGGDGVAFRNASSGFMWSDNPNPQHPVNNLAWQLEGTIEFVPLPMPLLLGAVGLLGMIPLRRQVCRSIGE